MPTDNGFVERFVGQFKLPIAQRRAYRTLGEFFLAAHSWMNFSHHLRPREG